MLSPEGEDRNLKIKNEEKGAWELPTAKLRCTLPRRKEKAALILGGSLNPPTMFHLRMFGT